MFCRVTFLTPPVPLFFFSSSIFFYSTPDGGMPMACARSALEWPNSFYPENVFRVTLPRKSKFVGLNWVLFHALRSLDCSSRDFCCYTLQRTDYPPVILSLSLSLSLFLSLYFSLSRALQQRTLAFSNGISSVVRPAACTFYPLSM